MNRWQDQFEKHPVHESLKKLEGFVNQDFERIDDEEIVERRHFIKLLSTYKNTLSKIDPEFFHINSLNLLNGHLSNPSLIEVMTVYKDKGTVAHLRSANDMLTQNIAAFAPLLTLEEAGQVALCSEIEKLVDYTSQTLVEEKDKLKKELKLLEKDIEEQSQKANELSTLIDTNKADVQNHISEWQQQFSTAQETRINDFSEWKNKFTDAANAEIKRLQGGYDDALNEKYEAFESKIKILTEDSNKKHEQVCKLYNLIAKDGVAGGYTEDAKKEEKQANNWRLGSIFFILAAVLWMLLCYNNNSDAIKSHVSIKQNQRL